MANQELHELMANHYSGTHGVWFPSDAPEAAYLQDVDRFGRDLKATFDREPAKASAICVVLKHQMEKAASFQAPASAPLRKRAGEICQAVPPPAPEVMARLNAWLNPTPVSQAANSQSHRRQHEGSASDVGAVVSRTKARFRDAIISAICDTLSTPIRFSPLMSAPRR